MLFRSAPFADDDGLLFGNEGEGSPAWLHEEIGRAHRLVIPQVQGAAHRSLNLSTAAGIATYEALRQTGLLGRGK